MEVFVNSNTIVADEDTGEYQAPSNEGHEYAPSPLVSGPGMGLDGIEISFDGDRGERASISTGGDGGLNYDTYKQRPGLNPRQASTNLPVASKDIADDTLITIGGMDVTFKAARAAGLIDGDLNLSSEVTAGTTDNKKNESKPVPDDVMPPGEGEAFESAEEEAALTEAVQQVPFHIQNMVLNSKYLEGDMDNGLFVRVAQELGNGAEPGEVAKTIEKLAAPFRKQADKILTASWKPGEVVEWVKKHRPAMLRDAIKEHTTNRSTKEYPKLVKEYVQHLDSHAPEDVLGVIPEQWEPKIERDGTKTKVTFNTSQGRMSWGTCIKNDWLDYKGFSRAEWVDSKDNKKKERKVS